MYYLGYFTAVLVGFIVFVCSLLPIALMFSRDEATSIVGACLVAIEVCVAITIGKITMDNNKEKTNDNMA